MANHLFFFPLPVLSWIDFLQLVVRIFFPFMHFGFIWYFSTVSGYRQTVRPLCFMINNCNRNCLISSPKLKISFIIALSFSVINQHWKSTNYYLLSSDFYFNAYFAGNIPTIFMDDNCALYMNFSVSSYPSTVPCTSPFKGW